MVAARDLRRLILFEFL